MKLAYRHIFAAILCVFAISFGVSAQDVPPAEKPSSVEKQAPPVVTGKPPIIVIPGITGSELINATTGKKVWFTRKRAKDDDIRLPISANLSRNRDSLVPGDIIREVQIIKFLPEVEIYERLIDSLQKRGGYREAKWDQPGENAHQDTFFVYPYDWRRDNVESARLLIRKIEELKKKIGRPDLKVNVIAHSMGGLVARYAAMYGDADIPGGTPSPTWAGAKHFDKVFLLGTPNEGSVSALDTLLNGYSYVGGINLPFIRDITRYDVFTVPSIYQLLPAEGSLMAYDEQLKPIKLDIYDPAVWEKYGWSIWKDENFSKRFTRTEQNNARPYFRAALLRARRFQTAINANSKREVPVSFYLIGAECKETANALIMRRDEKKNRWITQFSAKGFERPDGAKVSDNDVKSLLVTLGDGVVSKRSLAAETLTSVGKANTIPLTAEILQCETHSKLVTNSTIQDKLFEYLGAIAAAVPPLK